MNRYLIPAAGLAAIVAAVWYYRKRSAQIAASNLNHNQSSNSQLGQLAGQYPDRYTGQTGGAFFSNKRYSDYGDYLKQGGPNSNYKTFNEYLTATQAQTLPTS